MSNQHGFIHAEQANNSAVPLIRNIFGVSEDFLGQLKTWLEQNPPSIPVTQIVGFQQFVGNFANTAGSSTTTSATYTTLADGGGPQVTGLSPGTYLVMVGAVAKSGDGNGAFVVPAINGTVSGADNFAGETQSTVFTSIIGVSKQTLTAANNTIACRYRSNTAGNTSTFVNRWIFVLRLANA